MSFRAIGNCCTTPLRVLFIIILFGVKLSAQLPITWYEKTILFTNPNNMGQGVKINPRVTNGNYTSLWGDICEPGSGTLTRTIEAWVLWFGTNPSEVFYLGYGNEHEARNYIALETGFDYPGIGITGSRITGVLAGDPYPVNPITSANPLPINQWTHVAITIDYPGGFLPSGHHRPGIMKYFVNGVMVASGTIQRYLLNGYESRDQSTDYGMHTYLGASLYALPNPNQFNGKIENFRVSKVLRYTENFDPAIAVEAVNDENYICDFRFQEPEGALTYSYEQNIYTAEIRNGAMRSDRSVEGINVNFAEMTIDSSFGVTNSGAYILCTIKPRGLNQFVELQYSSDGGANFYTNVTTDVPATDTQRVVQLLLSNLSPSTFYMLRLKANTNTGVAYSDLKGFYTAGPPVMTLFTPVLDDDLTGFHVQGRIVTNASDLGGGASVKFYYAESAGGPWTEFGLPAEIQHKPNPVLFGRHITGFAYNKRYYFRTGALNNFSPQEVYSNVVDAMSGVPPTVELISANAVTAFEAETSFKVNWNRKPTSFKVQISLSESGPWTDAYDTTNIRSNFLASRIPIRDLLPVTRYYYRVIATSVIGSTTSQTGSFITKNSTPLATTLEPQLVTANSTQLRGVINPNGGAINQVYIDYGNSPDSLLTTANLSPAQPYTGTQAILITHNHTFPLYQPVYYRIRVIMNETGITDSGEIKAQFPFPDGPAVWYKAESAGSPGVSLSSWRDYSLNNRDASQSSEDARPVINEITFAGDVGQRKALTFDGSNDLLSFGSAFLNGKDYTIYILESRTSDKADNYFLGGTGTQSNRAIVAGYSNNSTMRYSQLNGADMTAAASFTINKTTLSMFKNAEKQIRHDYVSGSSLLENQYLTEFPGAALGGNPASSHYYQGNILEVLIYDRSLNNQEQRSVENYFNRKYKLVTPQLTISPAANVVRTSATFNGTINPKGVQVTYRFEYGTTPGNYTHFQAEQTILGGNTPVPVTYRMTGINSTLNYFRLRVVSADRTFYTAEETFETVSKPGVSNSGASHIKVNSAQLNVRITPNQFVTGYNFEWANNPEFNQMAWTGWKTVSDINAQNVLLTHTAEWLLPDQIYYYRVRAENDSGVVYSEVKSFRTLKPKPPVAVTSGYVPIGRNHDGEINWRTSAGYVFNNPIKEYGWGDLIKTQYRIFFRVNARGIPTKARLRYTSGGYDEGMLWRGLQPNFIRDAHATEWFDIGSHTDFVWRKFTIPLSKMAGLFYHPLELHQDYRSFRFTIELQNEFHHVQISGMNSGLFFYANPFTKWGALAFSLLAGKSGITLSYDNPGHLKASRLVEEGRMRSLAAGMDFRPSDILNDLTNEVLTMTATATVQSGDDAPGITYFLYAPFPNLDSSAALSTNPELIEPGQGLVTVRHELPDLEVGRVYYYRQVAISGEDTIHGPLGRLIPALEDLSDKPLVAEAQTGTFILGETGATLNIEENHTDGPTQLEASLHNLLYPSLIPESIQSYGNKYWRITTDGAFEKGSPLAGGGFQYSLTFDLSNLPDDFQFPYRTILIRQDSTEAWTIADSIPGVSLTHSYPYITVRGLNHFSEFTDALPGDAPLPVELDLFNAKVKSNNVDLIWTTVTEVNNYGFEVQRNKANSTTGEFNPAHWQSVTFIPGFGNSNSPQKYTYSDKNLEKGKYRYRLKQIDTDGSINYSSAVEAEIFGVPLIFSMNQNYPNPFNPETTLEFTIPEDGLTELRIYNALGEQVETLLRKELKAGELHKVQFNASRYASGVYFARLNFGKKQLVRKMLLMK
ncbi:MAG: hypothetical protein FMNOHCHN_00964 [Ignavibacteriaceae bacterium]|nr:hypothetical protein [Ignavibacteriaceae bacterium]